MANIISKKDRGENNLHRLIVAGSRGFDDYAFLEKYLLYYVQLYDLTESEIEIVSGGARGADRLGEKFAREYGCKLTVMHADWDLHAKKAGFIRNTEMAEYVKENGGCIVFWDGVSSGTKHMIDIAKRFKIKTVIAHYDL